MRRVIGTLAGVATLAAAATGLAAISGGLHDLTNDKAGGADAGRSACAYCHLPHGGDASNRLWATTTMGTGAGWNTATQVAKLCGSCHYANAYSGALPLPHDMTATAYAASAHGYTAARLPTTERMNGNYPYENTTVIECSSCHDPHNNTIRPFLRPAGAVVDQQTFCEECHDKGNANLSGAANTYTTDASTPYTGSMHPVSLNYATAYTTGNGGEANGWEAKLINPTIAGWIGEFQNDRGATEGAVGATPLGGKLVSNQGTTGNMGCVTCHQVHGDEGPQHNSYLTVVENYGAALAASNLCEACHDSTSVMINAGADVPSHPVNVADQETNATLAARFSWTPWTATTGYEQTQAQVDWPQYVASARGNIGIGCSSCHSAHNGLAGTPILRTGGDAEWCASCHTLATAAPLGHHSNIHNDTGMAAASIIDCVDCHEGRVTADVNPANVDLAATAHRDWLALRNDLYADRQDFCLNCHAGTATTWRGAANFTLGSQDKAGTVTYNPTTGQEALMPARHGVDRGNASHYLGAFKGLTSTVARALAWENGAFSAYEVSNAVSPAGWMQAGLVAPTLNGTAANNGVICESCHSVAYNFYAYANGSANARITFDSGWRNNLLLQPFEDDAVGIAQAGSAVGSLFCVGCHAGGAQAWPVTMLGNMPSGTHPVTGSIISKVVDAQRDFSGNVRTTNTLLTGTAAPAISYANIGPNTMSYPAANQMDCDSCHRAHDADDDSTMLTSNLRAIERHFVLETAASPDNVQSMCTDCHGY